MHADESCVNSHLRFAHIRADMCIMYVDMEDSADQGFAPRIVDDWAVQETCLVVYYSTNIDTVSKLEAGTSDRGLSLFPWLPCQV